MSGEKTTTPTLGLLGPKVDDEIRRAIAQYGSEAVKEATKRLTAKRSGPHTKPDWVKLGPLLDADVQAWLGGGDPFSARSDYSIAEAFAAAHPGHGATSTAKRIQRKLKRSRRLWVYSRAWEASQESFSYLRHLEALEALASIPPAGSWDDILAGMRAFVDEYTAKFGTPAPTATMREVQDGAIAALSSRRTGLLVWNPPGTRDP